MGISILLILFAIAGAAIYALSNYTSYIGTISAAATGGITGFWVDLQTSFSNLVLDPALAGDYYAMFALFGVMLLALVLVSNLFLTNFRAAVQ